MIFGLAAAAPVEKLDIDSQFAIYQPAKQSVRFQIIFNRPPDFFTTDERGRQADAFQYLVENDTPEGERPSYAAVVRGSEIYLGAGIPIRSAVAAQTDSASGGWGPVRSRVPFTPNGKTLTFEAPVALLGKEPGVGHFKFRLQVYSYGSVVRSISSRSSVGEPPACKAITHIGARQRELTISAASGLRTVKVVEEKNASVDVPNFHPGTTRSLQATITGEASVKLLIEDSKGNTTECDVPAGSVQAKR